MSEQKYSKFFMFLKFFFAVGLLGVIASLYIVYKISQTLPDASAIFNYNPEKATYVYDSSGNIMGEIAIQKRTLVQIDEIPIKLKQAFIAAEDKTFYENNGIDLLGLIKAMLRNIIITIREPGARYQGASTITQQVVRNILLSNERTATRKLKEMILAYKVTKQLSKDKILEIYLNHIYLGSRSYGVASASKEYFDKELNELTIDEMALIACLPKAPSALDPTKNTKRALGRRDYVLKQMFSAGYITKIEYEDSIKKNIIIRRKRSRYTGDAFIDYVRQEMYRNGITEEQLLTGGYTIKTTMKDKWQEIAQSALDRGVVKFDRKVDGYRGPITKIKKISDNWLSDLKNISIPQRINKYTIGVILKYEKNNALIGLLNGSIKTITPRNIIWAVPELENIDKEKIEEALQKYNVKNILDIGDIIAVSCDNSFCNLEQVPEVDGAVIILSPKTGELYSIIGGYGNIRGTFNRSFQAKRQPGSTAKIFTYLAALNKGIAPNEIFMDSEISYDTGDGTVWSPKNWNKSYLGPITMRTAFEKSVNTVTIRLAEKIGISNVVKMMKKIGAADSSVETNLGICLGTGTTTLLDIARSFAIIGNYGKDIHLKSISSVEMDKKIIHLNSNNKHHISHIENIEDFVEYDENHEDINNNELQIVSEQVAYQMISFLIGSVQNGTSKALNKLGFPIAAKTGTSQNGQSLWAIGFTPDVLVGVYIGHDIPREKDNNLFAAGYATPILFEIFENIKLDLLKSNFKVPDGIKMVKINKATGLRSLNNKDSNSFIYEAFKSTDKIPEEYEPEYSDIMNGTFDGVY